MNAAKRASVTTGSIVALSTGAEATWYEVVETIGNFELRVREAGTEYAAQHTDRSLIKQVKAA